MTTERTVTAPAPLRVDAAAAWDPQWRLVTGAYEALSDAYYGAGVAGAPIGEIVMRFVRHCHELKESVISANAQSQDFTPAALHHFFANSRALEICDALYHINTTTAATLPATALIRRTYTDPNGRGFALLEYARHGGPTRTVDAIIVAENSINEWSRFIRKQQARIQHRSAPSDAAFDV